VDHPRIYRLNHSSVIPTGCRVFWTQHNPVAAMLASQVRWQHTGLFRKIRGELEQGQAGGSNSSETETQWIDGTNPTADGPHSPLLAGGVPPRAPPPNRSRRCGCASVPRTCGPTELWPARAADSQHSITPAKQQILGERWNIGHWSGQSHTNIIMITPLRLSVYPKAQERGQHYTECSEEESQHKNMIRTDHGWSELAAAKRTVFPHHCRSFRPLRLLRLDPECIFMTVFVFILLRVFSIVFIVIFICSFTFPSLFPRKIILGRIAGQGQADA
jgi:hypothetical protein